MLIVRSTAQTALHNTGTAANEVLNCWFGAGFRSACPLGRKPTVKTTGLFVVLDVHQGQRENFSRVLAERGFDPRTFGL